MSAETIAARLADAWNTADPDAWGAAFTEDAVLVDVLGRVQRGREQIAREHGAILDTIYRGSRLDVRVLGERPAGDRVLAHSETTLTVPSGPRAGTTESVQTLLLRDGLIEAFQNTIRTNPGDFVKDDPDPAR